MFVGGNGQLHSRAAGHKVDFWFERLRARDHQLPGLPAKEANIYAFKTFSIPILTVFSLPSTKIIPFAVKESGLKSNYVIAVRSLFYQIVSDVSFLLSKALNRRYRFPRSFKEIWTQFEKLVKSSYLRHENLGNNLHYRAEKLLKGFCPKQPEQSVADLMNTFPFELFRPHAFSLNLDAIARTVSVIEAAQMLPLTNDFNFSNTRFAAKPSRPSPRRMHRMIIGKLMQIRPELKRIETEYDRLATQINEVVASMKAPTDQIVSAQETGSRYKNWSQSLSQIL